MGLASSQRTPAAPELPTVAEQGFPGFAGEPWSGFFAPKGTPKAIVDKIANDIIEVRAHPM